MVVIGFDERVEFRIREDEKERALRVIAANSDLYDDLSHFARACFIRGLRSYPDPVKSLKRGGGS